ncbi:MAG TPA: M28 family peptidase [Gemmatimonadales bacterium]
MQRTLTAATLLATLACSHSTPKTDTPGPASAGAAAGPSNTSPDITPADLRTRLYAFADDSMQGRKAGTPGNVKATEYLAREAARIGLEPAGDDGGWFQTIPMVVRVLDTTSSVSVGSTTLRPWNDIIPRDQGTGARSINGVQAVYGGVWSDKNDVMISRDLVAGKLVVLTVAPKADRGSAGLVNRAVTTARFAKAAGIAVVTLDAIGPSDRASLEDGGARLASGARAGPETPAFFYVTTAGATALLGKSPASLEPGAEGQTVHGRIAFTDREPAAPARNVVALLPGTDPALKGEMVAIGAHNDHEGIFPMALDHDSIRAFNRVMRPEGANDTPGKPTEAEWAQIRHQLDSLRRVHKPRPDSIMNGADDDGSGSVGVLEIAEYLAHRSERPKRSILFVWHTGEELGLIGSDYFTRHPTVPRDSIVAQLNIDMIGRGEPDDLAGGGPGYLQVIGSRRLSTELGDMVEAVNREQAPSFRFDYSYDADGHPDNYYCRSDHYMYARFSIPIAFFSSGSHRDYHQVTDEPEYIDYDKMAHVSRLVAATALRVAALDHRVVVDKAKPDPDAPCRQ